MKKKLFYLVLFLFLTSAFSLKNILKDKVLKEDKTDYNVTTPQNSAGVRGLDNTTTKNLSNSQINNVKIPYLKITKKEILTFLKKGKLKTK